MKDKGRSFYYAHGFFAVMFAVQTYYAYRGRELGETALYGVATVSCVGLILYMMRVRRPKPPAR